MYDEPLAAHIAAVLAWRARADPHGRLRRRARVLLRTRIEALFDRAAPPEVGAQFRSLFEALPPAGRRRLLDTPDLWGRILQDLDADTSPFLDFANAERERLLAPPRNTRLPQGAVLDADSPSARARIPCVVEKFSPYAPAEVQDIHTRLRAAGHLLHQLCPEASALVAGFTKTVVIRRDPDNPERWMSESTEGFLGRTVLCNPHLPTLSPLDLVEALVHESIHSWLSTVELFDPLLPDREAAQDLVLVSPWTGNALDAQRFVHAALVWAGLRNLWARAEVASREHVAQAGFEGPALADALDALGPFLSAVARALLRRVIDAPAPGSAR